MVVSEFTALLCDRLVHSTWLFFLHFISERELTFTVSAPYSVDWNLCTSLLYFVVGVRCRRKESSRSLSHLLMSLLFWGLLTPTPTPPPFSYSGPWIFSALIAWQLICGVVYTVASGTRRASCGSTKNATSGFRCDERPWRSHRFPRRPM